MTLSYVAWCHRPASSSLASGCHMAAN